MRAVKLYSLLILFLGATPVYAQNKLTPISAKKAKRTKWEHPCNSEDKYCNCVVPPEDVPDSAVFIVNKKVTRTKGTTTKPSGGIGLPMEYFECKPSRFYFSKNKDEQYRLADLKILFDAPRYDAATFWHSAYMSYPLSERRITYLHWAVEMYNRQHGLVLQSYRGLTSKRRMYMEELERIKEETLRRLPSAIRERLKANPKLLER